MRKRRLIELTKPKLPRKAIVAEAEQVLAAAKAEVMTWLKGSLCVPLLAISAIRHLAYLICF